MGEPLMRFLFTLLIGGSFFIGASIGSYTNQRKQEYYKISCLELNLGKETCDKIFNNKKE
ncbi:MAG: hypothetical protein RI930_73 [Pseudomonadota bacterium]|jgi:hypothetical protein